MNPNSIPKYSKVEIIFHTIVFNGKNHYRSGSTYKDEYLDCGLMITGDYLIIIMDEKDELKSSATSTGKIFPMSEVKAYKTYAQ